MTFNTGHFNRIRFNRSEEVPEEVAEASIEIRASMMDTTNWLDGWAHRKSHVFSASEEQTNYPVRVTIHRSSGTDSDDDVYIGSECEEDYADIRITASDGTTSLSYAFPPDITPDSSSATIDILIPSLPVGNTTIYIYYGNATASDASDPETVYAGYYDHFTSIDPAKWNTVVSEGYAVASSILTVTGDGILQSQIGWSGDYTKTTMRIKSHGFGWFEEFTIAASNDVLMAFFRYHIDEDPWFKDPSVIVCNDGGGGCVESVLTGWTHNTWHVLEVYRAGSGTGTIWTLDGGAPIAIASPYPSLGAIIRFAAIASGAVVDVDYVYARPYVAAVSHGSWGTEEDPTIISGSYVTWYPVAAEAIIEMTPETVGVVISFTAAEASIDITPETWPAQVFQDIHSMRDLHQVAFVSGKHAPDLGGIVVGATSGTRAEIVAITLSTGTWGVDAAGTLYIRILSGAGFIPGEKLNEA